MSREPSDRMGTPKGEKSKRTKKIDWDKVKVFDKPEYLVPYKLAKYMPGKRSKNYVEPELWLQVGIESGLVATASRDGETGGEWMQPLDDNPPAYMKAEDLEALLKKYIDETNVQTTDIIKILEMAEKMIEDEDNT